MSENEAARPLLCINMPAPEFAARTTMGERALSSYRGHWLVFFSHPADFTPVCTSEFVAFARAMPDFAALGCHLLAVSVDSLFSHLAWVRAIRDSFGVTIGFPIAEDPSMAIAAAYGMLAPDAGDSSSVRATFVIDPEGIVRAIVWYPMSVGRSVAEILRLVTALQTADRHAVSIPEGWTPGDPVLDAPAVEAAEALESDMWYCRTRAL